MTSQHKGTYLDVLLRDTMVVGCLICGINTCIYLLKMSYMAHMSLLENLVADIDIKFGKKIQKNETW